MTAPLAATPPASAAFDASPDDTAALAAIDSLDPVVFVLGRAGTGKTRLLRHVAQRGDRRTAVVAPTGLAALNAGGQTIHSLFGLSPFTLGPSLQGARLRKKLLKSLDLLLVDEVSMVRADLVDAMDAALRRAREVDAPFGDVQVVFFGDFLQLPPVVAGQDGQVLHEMGYRSPFAFDAQILREVEPTTVEMAIVHRQQDDGFIDVLARVRSGDPDAVTILNDECCGPHRTARTPVLLTATNRLADLYNERGLNALPGDPAVYEGKIADRFQKDRLPAPHQLALKPQARVIATRNDAMGRFVNGSLGTVVACEDGRVIVRFDGRDDPVGVEPVSWDSVRYDVNGDTLTKSIVGSYKQVPLTPAWAITIHKSQGLTLEDVRVDLGRGAFASGQAYVALSRARTMEGLSLARPLTPSDLMRDEALERFA